MMLCNFVYFMEGLAQLKQTTTVFYAIVSLEDQLWLHYLFVQAKTLKGNWNSSSSWIDYLLEGT